MEAGKSLASNPTAFAYSLRRRPHRGRGPQSAALLLEGLRIGNRRIGLLLDEGLRLIRAQGLAEKLVDRVQVDRQGKNLVAARDLHPVLVGLEGLEAIDVIPDFGIVGMENMRTVDVGPSRRSLHRARYGSCPQCDPAGRKLRPRALLPPTHGR